MLTVKLHNGVAYDISIWRIIVCRPIDGFYDCSPSRIQLPLLVEVPRSPQRNQLILPKAHLYTNLQNVHRDRETEKLVEIVLTTKWVHSPMSLTRLSCLYFFCLLVVGDQSFCSLKPMAHLLVCSDIKSGDKQDIGESSKLWEFRLSTEPGKFLKALKELEFSPKRLSRTVVTFCRAHCRQCQEAIPRLFYVLRFMLWHFVCYQRSQATGHPSSCTACMDSLDRLGLGLLPCHQPVLSVSRDSKYLTTCPEARSPLTPLQLNSAPC